MGLHLQSLCLCLSIGVLSCAHPSSPDRSASTDTGGPAGLVLKEGVTGQITDDKGIAVEGATVLAASLDVNGPAIPEIAIVSDANGRYQWPLRPGRYELTIVAERYQRVSRRVSFSAGEVTTVNFRLPRNP